MELSDRQKRLLDLVIELHGEERKYSGGPYWQHVVRVGTLVDETEPLYPLGWEMGLCHDLVEDKKCTLYQLGDYLFSFGYSDKETHLILAVTHELTNTYCSEDFPTTNRNERKRLEALRLSKVSYMAQTVKYADIIDNLPSTVEHDPEFGVVYWTEKMNIVERMRNGNFDLLVKCCAILHETREILKSKGYL